MKPKFRISEIVRIKATGEKVKILGYFECDKCGIDMNVPYPYKTNSKESTWYSESELKPYRPSRTGKFRNYKGQFISKCMIDGWCKKCKKIHGNPLDKAAQEQREHFSYEDVSNYQKFNNILIALDRIEKKIDKLYVVEEKL